MNHIRLEFVLAVKAGEETKSALCREYGISRPTGDKWLKRYANGEGLDDRGRAPFHSPYKTSTVVEQKVLDVREKHPAWGARKIHRALTNAGETSLPAASTTTAILKRAGRVSEKASRDATPYKRFQREHPNELWQCDFKGHFAMLDGNRCHPLTVLDDHSRFSLCVDAKANEQEHGVRDSFLRIFKEYGLPDSILCDNGPPWGSSGKLFGHTALEVFFMDYGILPMHGKPNHPQTQGKDERFHSTMVKELISRVQMADLADAQQKLSDFRDCYNTERPHAALTLDTPSKRYTPSTRPMPPHIEDWVYAQGTIIRSVHKGYIRYKGREIFVSEGLSHCEVGLAQSDIPGQMRVLYRGFVLGILDADSLVYTRGRIERSERRECADGDKGDEGRERDEGNGQPIP